MFFIGAFLYAWHIDTRIRNGGPFPFCETITDRDARLARRAQRKASV
jgi:hypothetical protein